MIALTWTPKGKGATPNTTPRPFCKPVKLKSGAIKFDAIIIGGIPTNPLHRPSDVRVRIGRYHSQGAAMWACTHYLATGEKTEHGRTTSEAHPEGIRRTWSMRCRKAVSGDRWDVKGRESYGGGKKSVANIHICTEDTEDRARIAAEQWQATGKIRQASRKVIDAPRPAQKPKPVAAIIPAIAALRDSNPRAIQPGESRTEWMARIYRGL